MTQAERNDLLIGFNIHESHKQKAMINEYLNLKNGEYCKKNSLFDYLKERLEIETYWTKIGLCN